MGVQGTHTCTFQPRAGSAISILVNVTQPHALPTLSYFKEPFWLHQAGECQHHRGPCPCPCLPGRGCSILCPIPCNTSPLPTVLTDAPQLVQATVSQGQLSLQWLPPLEVLAEQLDYQVRYAVEKSHDWKVGHSQGSSKQPCPPPLPAHGPHAVRQDGPAPHCLATTQQPSSPAQLGSAPQVLQVPRAARKEVLDLRPGARYHAQVRAQPSGPWYRGSWSAWSKPVVVDAMASAGKGQGRSGGRSHMAEGRRPGVLETGWGAPSDRAAVWAQGRATVPAFLLRRRLDHPERYGGAAALHRSAPGAAVHLPFPLQVRAVPGAGGGSSTRPGHPAPGASGHPGTGVCLRHPLPRTQQREAEALAPRPRPAPHAGQLPPRKQQARPGEGAGAGPAAAEPPRGRLEGRPSPRPLCVSPRPTPSTSSRRRRPSCPACWRCCPARGGSRARRRLRRSTPPAACPAPTSLTSPTCS